MKAYLIYTLLSLVLILPSISFLSLAHADEQSNAGVVIAPTAPVVTPIAGKKDAELADAELSSEVEVPDAKIDDDESSQELVRAVSHNVSIKIEANRIFPEKVQVNPGTTIVWINNTGGTVKVRFTSEAVSTTCKAPRGFGVGPGGIYISDEIAVGGVASLCFLEPNEYAYEVDYLDVSESGELGRSRLAKVLVGG